MYIVHAPSTSENYGGGSNLHKAVRTFNTEDGLQTFLKSYTGDIGRLEIYEAKPLEVNFVIRERKDAT
jgi:hypothetical protein